MYADRNPIEIKHIKNDRKPKRQLRSLYGDTILLILGPHYADNRLAEALQETRGYFGLEAASLVYLELIDKLVRRALGL